jgi:hypothetical protein
MAEVKMESDAEKEGKRRGGIALIYISMAEGSMLVRSNTVSEFPERGPIFPIRVRTALLRGPKRVTRNV